MNISSGQPAVTWYAYKNVGAVILNISPLDNIPGPRPISWGFHIFLQKLGLPSVYPIGIMKET